MHAGAGSWHSWGGERQLRSGPESLAEAERASEFRNCTKRK